MPRVFTSRLEKELLVAIDSVIFTNSIHGTTVSVGGTAHVVHFLDDPTEVPRGREEGTDGCGLVGGPRWDRTSDHLIKSQVLYH